MSTDVDKKAVEETVEHGTEAAESRDDVSAVNAPIASTEVGEAVVTFETENAYVSVKDQILYGKTLTAELHKELKFVASADPGYEVSEIKAKNSASEDVAVTTQDGVSTIAADDVDSTLVVTVKAKAVEAEEPPATETTPITGDTKVDSSESSVEVEGEGEIDDADGVGVADKTADEGATEAQEPEADDDSAAEDEDVVKVEADVSNPAFEGYAKAGNVLVKVTAAEGVLPEGATVQATRIERQDVVDAVEQKVESQGKALEDAVAVDVTLHDEDGKEIQPEGAVNVCFFDANVEGDEVSVFRVSDDAAQVETIGTRQADAAVQSFDVDHFTIYVVSGTGDQDVVQKADLFETVNVGESIVLTSRDDNGQEYHATRDHVWTMLRDGDGVVELSGVDTNSLTVKGIELGTITLSHSYTYQTEENGRWTSAVERVQVTVVNGFKVTIQLLNEANDVVKTEEAPISSGSLADNAPSYEGYVFERAAVGDASITYAEQRKDGVYYAVEGDLSTGVGVKLDEGESIVLQYKELGNNVLVSYNVTGDDGVEGNQVSGFPSTVEQGGSFNFRVDTARGYEVTVTWNGTELVPTNNTYTVSDAIDAVVVDIAYKKIETVTFDPGVFVDTGYKYLYTDGEAALRRFDFVDEKRDSAVQEAQVGNSGASFTFEFKTRTKQNKDARTWQIDSFNINGIYLNIPTGREAGASATTTLYSNKASTSDAAASSGAEGSCTATLTITKKEQAANDEYALTYALTIAGAKEDLEIKEANLNQVTFAEVIPLATEGISFSGKMHPNDGDDKAKGLNVPYYTADYRTPQFKFSLQEGYKNLVARESLFHVDGYLVTDSVQVQLPDGKGTNEIKYGDIVLAKISNDGNGLYTVDYTSAGSYSDSKITLQYLELTCEKTTYGIQYDSKAGSGVVADDTVYNMVDNTLAVVTNAAPQAPSGSFFYGWKIEGDTSGKRYFAGDTIDFSDEKIRDLLVQDGMNDGSLKLVAQYVNELPNTGSVPVSVEVYVMDKSGEYNLDSDKYFVVNGIVGKTVSYLNVPSYDGLVFENGLSQTEVVAGGSERIELYYSKQFTGNVSLEDWTYGNKASTETFEVSGGNYSAPTYCYKPVEGGDFSSEKPTAADRYIVKAVWAATETCREVSATDEFTINKRPVTITADSSRGNVYTGSPFTVETSSVTSGSDFVSGVTYAVEFDDNERTDVGTSHPMPKNVVLQGDDLSNYKVSYAPGVLEVVRANASVYKPSVSITGWTYDGTFDPGKTLKSSTSIEGHDAPSYSYLVKDGEGWEPLVGEPVDAGEYKVVAEWAEAGNYPALKAECVFSILKRDLAVSDSATFTYNGQEQVLDIAVKDNNVTGLVEGETLKLEGATIKGKDVDTYTEVSDSYTWTVDKKSGVPSTDNYNMTVTGQLVIEKAGAGAYGATVEITGWTYDGTFDPGKTLKSSTSIEGHDAPSYSYLVKDGEGWEPLVGEPVDAGEYKVVAEWAEAGNYPALKAECVFSILKRDLAVSDSATFTYNGQEQVLDIAVKDNNVTGLVEGETLSLDNATIIGKDFGTYTKVAEGYAWTVEKADSSASTTDNYTITVTGKLTINRLKVKLVSDDAIKVYDGTPLVRPVVQITEGEIVNGELRPYAVGSITDVGEAKNIIQFENSDESILKNYETVHQEGMLIVVPQSVDPDDKGNPDPNNPDKPVYDGIQINKPTDVDYNAKEQKWVPTVTDKNGQPLVRDTDYTVSYNNDVTNVGTVTVTISGKGNYGGTVERTYKITPKKATIHVNSASKKFNTDDPAFSGTIDGLIEGDSLGDVSYIRTNKDDEAVNTYTGVLTAEISNPSKNYDVTVVNGNFTIEPADGNQVTITAGAEGFEKTYNGKPSSIAAKADVEGSTLHYSTDGGATWSETNPEFTNAGTYTVLVKATHPGYEETAPVSATIVIKKAPVTITVNNASKVFGSEDPSFIGSVKGLVKEGDLGDVSYARADVDKEKQNVGDDIQLVASYTENDNYEVEVVPGKLLITPLAITADEPGNVVYNGAEQKQAPKVTDENGKVLVSGVDYEVTYSEDATNVGTVTVTITGIGNYAGAVERTYDITPAPAVIKVSNDSKLYGEDDPVFTGQVEGLFGSDLLGTVVYSRINTDEVVNIYPGVLTATVEGLNPNYTYAVVNGDFTIAPAGGNLVHIDATGLTKTYDGQSVSVTAAADRPGSTLLYSTDGKNWSEVSTPFTNAGTYTVYVKATNPNFAETPVATAQVVIKKAPVTITVKDASKMYGSEDPAFDGSVSGLVAEGDLGEIAYERSGGGEEAGRYPEVLTATYTSNPNYSVTVLKGAFIITPQAISTNDPADVVYNGTEQKWLPDVTDPNGKLLIEGQDYRVSYEGDTTNAGAIKVTITGIGNYAGTVERTYKITPAAAIVKVDDSSKVYGTKDPVFTGQVEGLFGDDSLGSIAYVRTNANEEAGRYEDVLTATIANLNPNYTYTVDVGDFTIVPADSNLVSAKGRTKTYDKQAVSVEASALQPGSTLLYSTDGEAWSEINPTFTDAGSYTVRVKATNPNFNETPEESVNVVIEQAPLTIAVKNASKVYGTDDPEFEHEVSGLLEGDELGDVVIKRANDAQDAGTYPGVLKASVDDRNPNYAYAFVPGSFTIEPADGNAAHVDGVAKTYDGQPAFVKASADESGSTLLYSTDDKTWSEENPPFTDAGTYTVYVKATNPNFNETDVATAQVVIDQAPVTITVNDAQKKFGSDDPDFTGTVNGLVAEGDLGAVGYVRMNAQQNVGVYADVLTATYTSNPNYKVAVANGTFEITPQAISANGPTDAVYNGQEQKWTPQVTDESGNVLVEGVDYTVAYSEDVTNVGTVTVTITGTGNYAGTVERTYSITPAAAVIRVNDASKLYGEDDPAFTGAFEGIFGEDSLGTVVYSRTGNDEEVGTYEGVLTAMVEGLNPNYTYNVVNGDFAIEPADGNLVRIDATGLTKTYDGRPVSVSAAADQPGSTLLYSTDGETWSEENPSFTDAGTYKVYVKATNPNFNETAAVSANVVINRAPVTITVDDASKKFGSDDPAFVGTVIGLVAEGDLGDVNYVRASGEENVGVYANALTALYAQNANYKVTVVNGIFEITPQTISSNDPTDVVYNGQEQKWSPTVTDENGNVLVEGVDYTVSYGSDATNAGTVTVIVTGKGNYAGTVDRVYTITPAPVTITVADASKVAGTADPGFTGTVEGLVAEGDLGAIAYSRTNADEAVGTYTDVLTATYADSANYAVTVVPGTFTITAAAVTPVPTPTPTTPPTTTTPTAPIPTPLPTPGTPPADNPLTPIVTPVVDALAGVAEAVIGDNETPLAQGENRETEIADNGTPLAGRDHVNCWVHFYIILGIIVTAIYGACVALRRSLFSRKLKGYENNLTGGDPARGAPAGKENDAPAAAPATIPVGATMAAGLSE